MFEVLLSVLTLTALELVLGIDNLVFLTLLVGRLPAHQRPLARRLGVAGALVMRLGLLFTLSAVMRLTTPWLSVLGHTFSGRDVILSLGGLFLVGKSAHEIYARFEEAEAEAVPGGAPTRTASFVSTVAQVAVLDIVFSLDSVIAALGMARRVEVMSAAVVLAATMMFFLSDPIGRFVEKHQGMKVLALSFLLLIGVLLIADGTGRHVEKGYVYFAMAFAFAIELLNIALRGHAKRALERASQPSFSATEPAPAAESARGA